MGDSARFIAWYLSSFIDFWLVLINYGVYFNADHVLNNLTELAGDEAGGNLEPGVGHPFGGTHDTLEPHHLPVPDLSTEDTHILPSPGPQLNLGHHSNWDYFGARELLGQGEFGMWMDNQGFQSEFALPQSKFTAPQPTFSPPQLNFTTSQTPFVSPQPSGPIDSPDLSTGSFVQQSLGQQPAANSSFSNSLQPHISGRSVPSVRTLPPGREAISDAGHAKPATSEIAATALSSRLSRQALVSTPVRGSAAVTHPNLQLSKKILSKTPQQKHMKANVTAHYAIQRKRKQRVTQSSKQTPQATLDDDTAQPQPNSQLDSLSLDQQTVALAMRKYLGFHILTREAWPLEQNALFMDALSTLNLYQGMKVWATFSLIAYLHVKYVLEVKIPIMSLHLFAIA